MRGWMERKDKLLLGLDITDTSVKILELSKSRSAYCVQAYGLAERLAKESLSDTIARALEEACIKRRTCSIALPDKLVFKRNLVLKLAPKEEDILSEIELSAEQYLPYPLEELYYDFQIISKEKPSLTPTEIILVAAKIDLVDERIAAIAAAGLDVKLVDIESYALARAFDLAKELGGNPLMHMDITSNVVRDDLDRDAEHLMLGCGLALRYLYDQS